MTSVFMPTPYPKKQTIVIFVVCIVAVVAVALYVHGQKSSKQDTGSQPSVSTETNGRQADMMVIGTSTDWRKQFFGNASTSGSFGLAARTAPSSAAEKLTATEQLSRDVFTQYVNLKQVGLINNTAIVSSTVSSLLTKDYSGSDKPRVYTTSDIVISPDNSTAALKAYGNSVGALLKTYSPKQDSATLALAGMQGRDPSYVEKLQANATAYRTILTRLLAIPAPKSVSAYHLGLINGASDMIYITLALSVSGTDPMRAINGLSLYQKAVQLGLENLLMIRGTLATASITYGSSDGGLFFNIQKP